MARYYSYIWPILAPIYGPLLLLYMAYSCPYKLYIASAKRLVQIRYKAWRFLTAFRIILIFVPLNGVYIRVYMGHTGAAMGHACAHIWATREQQWGMHARIHGHIWGQQWGMHARIYGPHGSSNGACIRAYIAIYGGSNGACMRAYMGHTGAAMGHACAHTWAIYGGSNGACMRAYMAIYGGSNGACIRAYMASPIGRVGIGNNK